MRPHVMLGECTGKMLIKLQELGWGRVFVRSVPQPYEGEVWGFDNGMFALFTEKGKPIGVDDQALKEAEALFVKRYVAAWEATRSAPYVAVLPDLPFRGALSLPYSVSWQTELMHKSDWPWYLAVQEGMDPLRVDSLVFRKVLKIQGIFMGGTSHRQGQLWAEVAKRNGLRLHYGRCSTPRRLRQAAVLGCDSVDSAFPMWTKARLAEFVRVWEQLPARGRLF